MDIAPERSDENLESLAAALEEADARVRVDGVPDGLPFDRSREFLARTEILNLVTRFGSLDLTFVPSGTSGYEDLKRAALSLEIGSVVVQVASLDDVIRSKEAADRDKDRAVLPSLRRLQRELAESD